MKTTRYDEREVTELLLRRGVPTLAWAAVFAFFAFSGFVSQDEPKQTAGVAPVSRLMPNGSDDLPARVFSVPGEREPEPRDVVVVEHEGLDPVGVGLNTPAGHMSDSEPPVSRLASVAR